MKLFSGVKPTAVATNPHDLLAYSPHTAVRARVIPSLDRLPLEHFSHLHIGLARGMEGFSIGVLRVPLFVEGRTDVEVGEVLAELVVHGVLFLNERAHVGCHLGCLLSCLFCLLNHGVLPRLVLLKVLVLQYTSCIVVKILRWIFPYVYLSVLMVEYVRRLFRFTLWVTRRVLSVLLVRC